MTLADIYALVELKSDHDKIERRSKAVANAITQIAKEPSKSAAQLGTLLLNGAPSGDLTWFMQLISDADQAFSAISSEFEVQVLGMAALNSAIEQSESLKKQKQFAASLRVAGVLIYGIYPQLGHRKLHPGLLKVASEACTNAATLLETQARYARARSSAQSVGKPEMTLPAVADATFPDSLKKILNAMHTGYSQAISELHRESRADREEADILWWLQTGYSKRLNKHLSEIPPNSGWHEIAEDAVTLVNVPPAAAVIYVLEKMVEKYSKPTENVKIGDLLGQTAQNSSPSVGFAEAYPFLFPSIIARSGSVDQSGWSRQTGLRSTIKLNNLEWTLWHYKQRVLERMLTEDFYVR